MGTGRFQMSSMRQRSVLIARSLIGMILGYAVFVFGTIIARMPFDPLSYSTSSSSTLAVAALVVPWAGVAAGIVTAAIVPSRPYLFIMPGCFLIALESSWLFITGRSDGPLWFEAGAAASLILGYVVGAALWIHLPRRRMQRR